MVQSIDYFITLLVYSLNFHTACLYLVATLKY